MKKFIIYIGILAIGLVLGSIIFSTDSNSEDKHSHETATAENQVWTCSMHPQIMQPEAGDCPICGMDLIPAETSVDGLSPNEFKMSKNAIALANIETSIVGSNTNQSEGLVLVGKIQENEKTNAIQTAHFGGRIEKLLVNSTGEKVHKGQLLALVYSPELVTAQKELLMAMESKNSDASLYNAVRNKLKLWKLSEGQITKIENSKKIMTNFPIYANVNGVVTMKMVEEGNYVKEGQGLFMIANLATVWANFDAYEKQLSFIKKGAKITITTNANPSKKIKSKISFIDPVLNSGTRTVTVRAELNNSKGELKPGMFVKGVLSLTDQTNVEKTQISIPKTAVLWTGERSIVYVKIRGTEPVFVMREVTLGVENNNTYEIIEGIHANEEIVTNGTFTVDAAAQLQGKKSMMNATGEKVMTGHENHIGTQETSILEEKEIVIKRVQVPSNFQNQLNHVFQNYLLIKDALVNDDRDLAQKSAIRLSNSLNDVDMKLLTDSNAHNLWMSSLKVLEATSKEISISNDIKSQREHFISMSNSMSQGIETFGVNQTIYKQFCPMANKDKGAIWLSTEEEIKNPYFGSSMLRCGLIQKTIEN